MKKTIAVTPFFFSLVVFGQQQYAEDTHPNTMATGVYYQSGPGSNNTLNWSYPYGTKLTIMGSAYRNFEMMITGYPHGELKMRIWDVSNGFWRDWRTVLTQNSDGAFSAEDELIIQDKGKARGDSFLKVSRGAEGKDRALVSFGNDGDYKWHTGMLYGGGWSTPDFYISSETRFRNAGVIDHEPEFTITTAGDVGIGMRVPNAKLAVNGDIHAKEVKVDLAGWPDYVFDKDHNLPSLEEVEQHIQEKGHLINIPSAQEVAEHGVQLGEMNKLLLEKIEELTLYTLQQQRQIKKLQEQLLKINIHEEK